MSCYPSLLPLGAIVSSCGNVNLTNHDVFFFFKQIEYSKSLYLKVAYTMMNFNVFSKILVIEFGVFSKKGRAFWKGWIALLPTMFYKDMANAV